MGRRISRFKWNSKWRPKSNSRHQPGTKISLPKCKTDNKTRIKKIRTRLFVSKRMTRKTMKSKITKSRIFAGNMTSDIMIRPINHRQMLALAKSLMTSTKTLMSINTSSPIKNTMSIWTCSKTVTPMAKTMSLKSTTISKLT